jgi:hypothetical protein
MTERDNNKFRFSLYQEDVLLCEEMFDADQFNPLTRYSIDIRDILPRAITKLQKVLSKKNYDTAVSDELDLYQYNQKMINAYPYEQRYAMKYNPKSITYQVVDSNGDNKTIKGVECKIGFYINEKPIVERVFYVDGFNPVSRLSLDVVEVVDEIIDQIFSKIKSSDLKNIWDDYDLINVGGYSINEIRDFTYSRRNDILRRINRN